MTPTAATAESVSSRSAAPTAGPSTTTMFCSAENMPLAAARSDSGTTSGTKAPAAGRVGRLTTTLVTARRGNNHIGPSAATHSAMPVIATADRDDVTTSSRRRS